ncbi:MAG: hypothetical protein RL660_2900 [Bacteroidota bacterium]|jgi:hypothetical protein
MKKIIIAIAAIVSIGFAACEKKRTTDNVTVKTIAPHFPTITLTGDQYYSIPVGGALPTISATAYDSTTNEVCTVLQSSSGLDNTTPGLYPVAMSAKNSDGYESSINAFVAVTNVPAAFDISGNYRRTAGQMGIAEVSKVKTGLYYSNNIFGVDPALAPGSMAGFYFVHVDDSTIIIPDQETDFGTMVTANVSFQMNPGADTFYTYSLKTLTSNAAIRKFVKE